MTSCYLWTVSWEERKRELRLNSSLACLSRNAAQVGLYALPVAALPQMVDI